MFECLMVLYSPIRVLRGAQNAPGVAGTEIHEMTFLMIYIISDDFCKCQVPTGFAPLPPFFMCSMECVKFVVLDNLRAWLLVIALSHSHQTH